MNKTLLLILCDFLLITLVSLIDWQRAAEFDPSKSPPAGETVVSEAEAAEAPAGADPDLLAALQLSLEAGREDREAIRAELEAREAALAERQREIDRLGEGIAEREVRAAELEAERQRLGTTLEEARRGLASMTERATRTAEEAAAARARMELLQRELQQRQEQAQKLATDLEAANVARERATEEARELGTQVKLAEQERTLLRQNLDALREEVVVVREEKAAIQQQAGRLTEGVTQLAERSAELREEIRDNRPINANMIFDSYSANRVVLSFTAVRPGLFGEIRREPRAETVLVSDGQAVYALLHVRQTPFSLGENPSAWAELAGTFSHDGRSWPARDLRFLAIDPRLAVVPVAPEVAAALGAKVHRLAVEPFKFPDAVLIGREGKSYGEVEFKLDARNPRYVRMPTNIVNRLLGDFTPSSGDLVFSKTGDLLGVMVNDSHCVLLDNFLVAQAVELSPAGGAAVPDALGDLRARHASLPFFLR